jgi:hypothetical protein
MATNPYEEKEPILQKLLKSRYFLYALLFHALIFIIFGGKVIFEAVVQKAEFETPTYLAGGDGGAPPPPAPATAIEQTQPMEEVSVQIPTPSTAPTDVIALNVPTPDAPTIAVSIPTPTPVTSAVTATTPTASVSKSFDSRASAIRSNLEAWGVGGGGVSGVGTATRARFVCYVAKYEDGGAGWYPQDDDIREIRDGKIFAGPIPNLMNMVNQLSRGNIVAEVVANPLNLSSQEIFERKPPFIYFTGSRDFRLTDAEIENLRKYLINGGAIWGDSRLVGPGSPFDVAFRREMKRIVPDADKPFVTIPNNHPLFVKSFYSMPNGVPPGMQFARYPLEAIKIDDEIAILYSMNNYTDLMRAALITDAATRRRVVDVNYGPNKRFVTPWSLWQMREIFFRNWTPESAEAAFQLGLNIIVHLLTRFQERLLLGTKDSAVSESISHLVAIQRPAR